MRSLLFAVITLCAAAASAVGQAPVEQAGRVALPEYPTAGYVPYAYPPFGSCPCGEDGCFHPRPYYACCGEGDPAYKKAFWRRWLRAHFHGGSMLDGVPCHCIYPPVRAYVGSSALVPPVTNVPPEPAQTSDKNPPAAPAAEPLPLESEESGVDAAVPSA